MIGNNELHLNQSTMVEAMQQYLDGQFATGKSPKVLSVSKDGNSAYGDSYVVKTEVVEAIK